MLTMPLSGPSRPPRGPTAADARLVILRPTDADDALVGALKPTGAN